MGEYSDKNTMLWKKKYYPHFCEIKNNYEKVV